MNVFFVKFAIGRSSGGGYHATCPELGAYAAAPTLPELEAKLKMLAAALCDEASQERASASPEVIVRRIYPSETSA